MKRLLSVVLTVAVLFMTCVMPVQAAESSDSVEGNNITAITSGTTYFSKITRKLNSLYGAVDSVNLSSGSCLGTNRQITSVTVYCRVSSGSSPFTLIVTSPSGTVAYKSCGTTSTTYTFTDFNGEDPSGTWNVGISSNGTVSTVTCTLKVYYRYD